MNSLPRSPNCKGKGTQVSAKNSGEKNSQGNAERQARGEFAWIARYLAPLSKAAPPFAQAFGLKDDAALLRPPKGMELVITKDAIAGDVHFFSSDEPALIARKLIRVNLSDLAAKGAKPFGYFLSLCLPLGTQEEWVRDFAKGLKRDQTEFAIHLLGGDTTSTAGPAVLSLTALGFVRRGKMIRRQGARPGDILYMTGSLGDAVLGLAVAKSQAQSLRLRDAAFVLGRYRLPRPPVRLGEKLAPFVHAAIDISDGLKADLGHLCDVSGVGAEIDLARLPFSAPVRRALKDDPALLSRLITGGDDYELLFAAPMTSESALKRLSRSCRVALAPIGRVVRNTACRFLHKDGSELLLGKGGYTHF
jgi:thiamine-monophosphate kinase